jgi:hypothetical protein
MYLLAGLAILVVINVVIVILLARVRSDKMTTGELP